MTARVLVVDDILANVKLLEARLAAEYFDVLTAYNGQEALDICERERVDVVLLDVMMPGMDGFEACRRLKANPKTHHIPVVMVTALDQPSDKVRGLESGADDFLTKPVDDIALDHAREEPRASQDAERRNADARLTGQQMGMSEDAALLKALSEERGPHSRRRRSTRARPRAFELLSKAHEPIADARSAGGADRSSPSRISIC